MRKISEEILKEVQEYILNSKTDQAIGHAVILYGKLVNLEKIAEEGQDKKVVNMDQKK